MMLRRHAIYGQNTFIGGFRQHFDFDGSDVDPGASDAQGLIHNLANFINHPVEYHGQPHYIPTLTAGQLETLKPLRNFDTGYRLHVWKLRWTRPVAWQTNSMLLAPGEDITGPLTEEQQLLVLDGTITFGNVDAGPVWDNSAEAVTKMRARPVLFDFNFDDSPHKWRPVGPPKLDWQTTTFPFTYSVHQVALVDATAENDAFTDSWREATGVFENMAVEINPFTQGLTRGFPPLFTGVDAQGFPNQPNVKAEGALFCIERY